MVIVAIILAEERIVKVLTVRTRMIVMVDVEGRGLMCREDYGFTV